MVGGTRTRFLMLPHRLLLEGKLRMVEMETAEEMTLVPVLLLLLLPSCAVMLCHKLHLQHLCNTTRETCSGQMLPYIGVLNVLTPQAWRGRKTVVMEKRMLRKRPRSSTLLRVGEALRRRSHLHLAKGNKKSVSKCLEEAAGAALLGKSWERGRSLR